MLEGIVIFSCGYLLTIAQMIEGDSGSNATFKDNLLLSLTTVAYPPTRYSVGSRLPQALRWVCVLALYGWTHWLLLSVASALIVARAAPLGLDCSRRHGC